MWMLFLVEFEKYTQYIDSKLLTKMDFDGRGLGMVGKKMTNPIQVEERNNYEDVGYSIEEVG